MDDYPKEQIEDVTFNTSPAEWKVIGWVAYDASVELDDEDPDDLDFGTGYEPDDPKGWVVSGDYPDFDSMRKAMKENG